MPVEVIVCRLNDATFNPTDGEVTHTWLAAQCGGTLPGADHVGMLAKAHHCGEDTDWEVLNAGETDGPGIRHWIQSGCQGADMEVVYVDTSTLQATDLIRCQQDDSLNPQEGSVVYTWGASDCGNNLPGATHEGALAGAVQCGGDQDWVALASDEAGGPGIGYWVFAPCANRRLEAVYVDQSGPFSDVIVCEHAANNPGSGELSHTFTVGECGGSLPDASYHGVLSSAAQGGGDHSWRVLNADETDGPGMAVSLPGGGTTGTWRAIFVKP